MAGRTRTIDVRNFAIVVFHAVQKCTCHEGKGTRSFLCELLSILVVNGKVIVIYNTKSLSALVFIEHQVVHTDVSMVGSLFP
jgi:hypothetical protein